MPKKRIIVTARGVRLDMDALKASQPSVKPLVINKNKEKVTKPVKQVSVPAKRSQRIYATVPAPIPTPADLAPLQIIPVDKPTQEIKHAGEKVKHVGQTVTTEPDVLSVEPTIIE